MLLVAKRVAGGRVLQAYNRANIARVNLGNFHTSVRVHLYKTSHALLFTLSGVINVRARVQNARICSEIRQTTYKRVGRNFECKSRKRLLVRGFSLLLRAGIGVNALNVLNVHGRGQKVDNRVQKHLYALVFVGGTAQNGRALHADSRLA